MAPTTDPARMRGLWRRVRSAFRADEPRLAAVLTVAAAAGLASWPIALIINGAVLAAAVGTYRASRRPGCRPDPP